MNADKPAQTKTDEPASSKFDGVDAALVLLPTLVALLLRWPQMFESLWIDELHTAWAVSGGLSELWPRCAIGNQSPVWFVLPWLSTSVLGMNEFALRLPSLLAGIALVPAVYWLVRHLCASRVGALVAASLVAFDHHCLTFAAEARPYAWVQLVGLLQVAAFWKTWRSESWQPRCAWIALSALLFYLHYTAILLLGAEVVFLGITFTFSGIGTTFSHKRWALDLLAVVILCLPAAPHLWEIAGRRENWEAFVEVPDTWRETAMFPIISYGVVPLLLVYGWVLWQKSSGAERPLSSVRQRAWPLLLGLCWLLVPLAIAWLTTVTGVAALWLGRYVIVSAAALPVAVGVLCSVPTTWPSRAAVAAATLVIAVLFVGPPWGMWWQTGYWAPSRGEDWRAAVAYIEADEEAANWPILLRPDLIEADVLVTSEDPLLREYCLLPIRSIYAVDQQRLSIPLSSSKPQEITPDDLTGVQAADGVWIVTRGSPRIAEVTFRLVLRALAQSGLVMENKNTQSFETVWVLRVEFTKEE